MMHRPLNQYMRLTQRAGRIQHILFPRQGCQRGNGPPRVGLPADMREAWIGYVPATVLVDDGDVGGGGEVEGVAADGAFVGEGEKAGD